MIEWIPNLKIFSRPCIAENQHQESKHLSSSHPLLNSWNQTFQGNESQPILLLSLPHILRFKLCHCTLGLRTISTFFPPPCPVFATTTLQLIWLNVRNHYPVLCASFSGGTRCQAYLNLESLYSKWAAPSIKRDHISSTLSRWAVFLWHHSEACAAGDFNASPLILPECVFLSAVIWSATRFGTSKIYLLLWTHTWNLKRVCMTVCVRVWVRACVFKGVGGRRREGDL